MRAWLASKRGSAVDVRVPQRGDKRALMETVRRNAEQSLQRHKLTRAGDLTARSQALAQLQEALALAEAPLRIECFDVSHVQGTQVVASMVVFEDGLARSSEYRRFIIKGDGGVDDSGSDERGPDDTASMREVLTRRFSRLRATTDEQSSLDIDTQPKKFAYPPNLLVVDGGLPQVNVAAAVLDELAIRDVAVVGLAKRLEEVWVPGQDYPVILPRTSEGLYLLQRVRDEAHRFAITFHRQRRSKAMTRSVLDGIPGLGPARQALLLKEFGSVKRLRAASPEQLQTVPGIGPGLAVTIQSALRADRASTGGGVSVNVTTGEVLDDD
mgnify:CR=1 FL=1